MIWFLVNSACILAVSLLVCRWLRLRKYWADRGVPHLPPHPIFGSLTFLHKKNPGVFMKEMYEHFRSPYVGIWLFWRPSLIINSPDIARNILVKDHVVFRNRLLGSGNSDPVGKNSILAADDPLWTSVRRRLTPVFTSAKLRAFHNLLNTKASELIQRIHNNTQNKVLIDLRHLYTDYTTDVVGTVIFGVVSDALLKGNSIMKTVTNTWMNHSLHRAMSWIAVFFCPDLVDIFRLKFFPENSLNSLRAVLRTVVKQRGGYDHDREECNDLIDALMKMKRDAVKEHEDISEDMLLAQAAILLEGGFATSSGNLTYITYELAHHPLIQERLYQELLEAKKKIEDADFNGNILSEMPYLNAIIKETLRKYPAMGWLDRIASKDYKIDENLTISAGTNVYVNAIAMHYNPDYFPNPEKFVPERFMQENANNILPFTYLPFGDGPRNCIGKQLALQMIRYAAASIFLNFEVRPLPSAPKPSEIEFAKRGLLLMPATALSVEFVPRNH